MKNIFLIILMISCTRTISSTTPNKKVSRNNHSEKTEYDKLEKDIEPYKLTYNLGEKGLYKIYKEDQKDLLDNIINKAINLIISLEDRNNEIIREFCDELTLRGIYTVYKDGRKDNIRILVEDIILNQIYIALKPAMFNNLSSEETNKIFEEVYSEILLSLNEDSTKEESRYLQKFLYKVFDEELNSFSTYKYLKLYLPNNVSYELKNDIFEAVRTRKYEKVRELLNSIRELYIKVIDNDFNVIEKETIKIDDKFHQIDEENLKERISIPSCLYFYKDKIYYKGVSLTLRKY